MGCRCVDVPIASKGTNPRHDLRTLLRNGASDEQIAERIRNEVNEKEAGHRINEPGFVPPSRTMVFIGG